MSLGSYLLIYLLNPQLLTLVNTNIFLKTYSEQNKNIISNSSKFKDIYVQTIK